MSRIRSPWSLVSFVFASGSMACADDASVASDPGDASVDARAFVSDAGASGTDAGSDARNDAAASEAAAPVTCGAAGGNTCIAAGSTLCDGLPLLASSDCAKCCARPPYPGPRAASFHIVVGADTDRWDSIWGLEQKYPNAGPMITSENLPLNIPYDAWTRKVGINPINGKPNPSYPNGMVLADAVHKAFQPYPSAPRLLMVDELNSGTKQTVSDFVDRMGAIYPQWAGRWGVFLVNGTSVHYDAYQVELDKLLLANALISVELYPSQSAYCASGTTAAERDQWLADFFHGDQGAFPFARFHWLMQRRAALASKSSITVLFGVTDTYMDGTQPAIFVDRMFYVWRNKSGYPSTMLLANGGVGAYKWDASAVGNSSRDLAFSESFDHYVVAGNTTSLKGQVTCP